MSGLITTVHIVTCVLIILFILLQQSRNDGMGSSFGGGGGASNSLIGSRSATTILTKITTICAVVFMVTSLTLAHFSSSEAGKSLMESDIPAAAPLAPADMAPMDDAQGMDDANNENGAAEVAPQEDMSSETEQ
jgi:preprotein translocase subunit SecG